MNAILWAIQIALAAAVAASGSMKVFRSKAQLESNPHMGWTRDVPAPQIKAIGVAEILGAIGVIVPAATGIAPLLTPLAAACLATLLGGAAATHVFRREPGSAPVVLAVLAIIVATVR
jgi:uncharacterized membrane protein YphA (DoxX/SURF4 family)